MRDEIFDRIGFLWVFLHVETFAVLVAIGEPVTVARYFGVLFGCMVMAAAIAGVGAILAVVFRRIKED